MISILNCRLRSTIACEVVSAFLLTGGFKLLQVASRLVLQQDEAGDTILYLFSSQTPKFPLKTRAAHQPIVDFETRCEKRG
jgi:hypothetical protein